jgi:hypothetical protein
MIISVISIIGKSLTIRGPDTARSTGPPGPNRRARRSALVALARRLVIALWRSEGRHHSRRSAVQTGMKTHCMPHDIDKVGVGCARRGDGLLKATDH